MWGILLNAAAKPSPNNHLGFFIVFYFILFFIYYRVVPTGLAFLQCTLEMWEAESEIWLQTRQSESQQAANSILVGWLVFFILIRTDLTGKYAFSLVTSTSSQRMANIILWDENRIFYGDKYMYVGKGRTGLSRVKQ